MNPFWAGDRLTAALLIGSLGLWVVSELRQRFKRRSKAIALDRGATILLGLGPGAGYLFATLARAYVPGADVAGDGRSRWLSLALIWAGLGLRWWAFRALGAYFTITVMVSRDQPVIQTGPYRLLRHPGYSALLLIFAGIGLLFSNWLSLAAMLGVPLLGLLWRIRMEEAALVASLGEPYRRYAATHKRLIPFVW